MDVVMATGHRWKRDGNGNEWLGDGWRDGDGDGWLGDGRLGDGRLGDGLRKGLAMDGVTATRRRWNDPTAMDDSTATAMNGSAIDGSARWTARWLGDGRL
jgi:hypothetical protein